MTQEECSFEAWQLIQARKILQWFTEGNAMSLGKQTFVERIEDTLFNIAYKKLGLKPIGKCSVGELQEEVIVLCDEFNTAPFYKISFAHIVDKTMCQDNN